MTDAPAPAFKKTPWWLPVLVVLGALPAVFSLGILGFITWYSRAHDERACPYHAVTTRSLGQGVEVIEEARRCIDAVEEHRWLVRRGTAEPRELGRYPLEAALIAEGFPWEASIEEGRVVLRLTNEGRGEMFLREPAAEGP